MTQATTQEPGDPLFGMQAREDRRLTALHRYDILDTPPEEVFDRLIDLASAFFGVDVAFVAFLDADRQWFKSSIGLDQRETALAGSFCTHTIEDGDLLVIEDAAENDRVQESPFVTETGLRFYAGMPLKTPEGHSIGTFSIMDSAPRAFSDEEARRLKTFAQMATDELEQRRESRQHEQVARRFEAVLNDPNLLSGVLAPDGTLLEANETALEYVDDRREEVLGRPFWETPWWPDRLQEDVRQWIERAARGEYVEYDADLTGQDGAAYSVEGTIRPVTSENGTITALVVSARDVTARKDREQELRLFRQVVEQANDAIIVTEAESVATPGPRIEYVNQAFEEMTGYRREEVLGQAPRMLGLETDRDVLDSLRAALEAGESWEGETVNYRKDGTPYQVRWSFSPVRGADGEIEHWMSVQQDITEKREREKDLRRQRNLLDQAQRLAGAWEVDPRSGEVSWSEKVYEIHELAPGTEMKKDDALSFFTSEARPAIEEAFERCVEEGKRYDLELPLITAKGNRRWVHVVGAPVEKENGEVVKVAGAFQDITERKQAEEELDKTRRFYEQVLEQVPIDLAVFSPDAEFEYLNPNSVSDPDVREWLIGHTNEEYCRKRGLDPSIGQRRDAVIRRAAQTKTTSELEETLETDEGPRHYLRVHGPVTNLAGQVTHVAAFGLDITEQREREQELRKKERRYEAVFEDPNILAGLLGTDGQVLDINQTALDYVGTSLHELAGDPFWTTPWFAGDEDLQEEVRGWIQRAAAGEYVEFEADLSEAVGQSLVISGVVRPVTNEEGEVTSLLISDRDVTERKQDRRRLEQYREYTDRLLNASDDLFFVVNADGTLQRWNERVATVTGYSSTELSSKNVLKFFPEEERERAREVIEEVFETGRSQLETILRTKEGVTIPYEFTGNHVQHPDGDLRLIGIGRDVTERKQREERLRSQRRKIESLYDATKRLLTAESVGEVSDRIHEVLQDVFDYALNNTAFVDGELIVPEKTTVDATLRVPNPEPQPVDGHSVSAQGLRVGETVVINDVQALDNTVDYGAMQSAAVIPMGKHGVIVVGQVHSDQFEPFDLHLIEVLGTYASMVMDRLGREETLRAAKEAAEEASRLKSAMLANMSHEIRTPLTSITGFAEILQEELDGRPAEFIEMIRKSGERLMRTLDSVLQLSKLEAGVYEMERTTVSLGEVVGKTVEFLQPSAEEKSVVLETQRPDVPVEGAWNRSALDRILENLLENAIKFTPEGGTIEVRAGMEDGEAVLVVEDTGVGIGEEARAKIFEAFQQESGGLAREYEGSGLGLSIVKRLVDAHNGIVEVESEKGVGSRFTVRLPLKPDLA